MKPLNAETTAPREVLKDGGGSGRAVHRSQGKAMFEGQKHTYFHYTLCFHNTNSRQESSTNVHLRPSPWR